MDEHPAARFDFMRFGRRNSMKRKGSKKHELL
jgi:hypothetical protein